MNRVLPSDSTAVVAGAVVTSASAAHAGGGDVSAAGMQPAAVGVVGDAKVSAAAAQARTGDRDVATVAAAGAAAARADETRISAAAAGPPAADGAPEGDEQSPSRPVQGQSPVSDAGGPSPGRVVRRRGIPPKLYRIGEVAEYSGVSRQTIHNYTTMGLIREVRWTNGGHRQYDEKVFERLDQIDQFKADRRSLEFIRKYFAGLDAEQDGV